MGTLMKSIAVTGISETFSVRRLMQFLAAYLLPVGF